MSDEILETIQAGLVPALPGATVYLLKLDHPNDYDGPSVHATLAGAQAVGLATVLESGVAHGDLEWTHQRALPDGDGWWAITDEVDDEWGTIDPVEVLP